MPGHPLTKITNHSTAASPARSTPGLYRALLFPGFAAGDAVRGSYIIYPSPSTLDFGRGEVLASSSLLPLGLVEDAEEQSRGGRAHLTSGAAGPLQPASSCAAWESDEGLVNTSCSAKQRWVKYVKWAI